MFDENPSKVFRPEDVGVDKALEIHRDWFRAVKFLTFLMRRAGHDEETIYEAILGESRAAGEPDDMVVEILYSDGSSLEPLWRSQEDTT